MACEHLFVTAQGSALTRYRRAVDSGNLFLAEVAMREMPHVLLPDALGLLALYADQGSPKFDRAATRWLARLALEKDVTLADVQLAAAALESLSWRGESAMRVLSELSR